MTAKVSAACEPGGGKVREEGFVPIGGIGQWVTIHGASCDNPVILFIHGCPGNTLSPFADKLYGTWESTFTLVQWDQRGAGKTWGHDPDVAKSALTIERMTRDGTELAAYLAMRLHKKKIILVGGSWGSVLAVHMAKARPDLFVAYVGAGQLVSYRENQEATWKKLIALARVAGDQETATTIEALGPPPWSNPRNFGIVRRATRKYEAKTTTAPPQDWWVPAAAYATPQAQADYDAGEDYSYLQFVGLKGDGMLSQVDLPRLGTRFDIPVFLVRGSEDLVTMPEVARRYYDTIEAPQKDFVLLPATGHDPNEAMVRAEYEILAKRIAPLAR